MCGSRPCDLIEPLKMRIPSPTGLPFRRMVQPDAKHPRCDHSRAAGAESSLADPCPLFNSYLLCDHPAAGHSTLAHSRIFSIVCRHRRTLFRIGRHTLCAVCDVLSSGYLEPCPSEQPQPGTRGGRPSKLTTDRHRPHERARN